MLVLVKRKQGHNSFVSAQITRKSLGLSESKESKPTYPMVRKKKMKADLPILEGVPLVKGYCSS